MSRKYRNIKSCRVCGFKKIIPLLFLGKQPLANSLKKNAKKTESRYPLTLVFCPKCSLVQLKETIKKEILFNNYICVTGTSEMAKKYVEIFYRKITNIVELKAKRYKQDYLIPFPKKPYLLKSAR